MHAIITTSSPESLSEAASEIASALGSVPITPLGDGLLRVAVADAVLAAGVLLGSRPVFVRHLVPVIATLDGHAADAVDALAAWAETHVSDLGGTQPVGVQIRMVDGAAEGLSRKDLWEAVRTRLEGRVKLDTRNPAAVFSVVAGRNFDLGFNPVELNMSAWAGGARHFAHAGDAISRAEYKLAEAFEFFGIAPAAGEKAVDLGAAPGGWTRHLALRGLMVTAVDPAALDARVLALPGVRHARVWADVHAARETPGSIDLLVNDMRMDASEAARLLVAMRHLLSPSGRIVTTLKLPKHGRVAAMRAALSILESTYETLQVKQLFHNRSEVTAWLAPRAIA